MSVLVDVGDRITLSWAFGSSATVTGTVTLPDASTSSLTVSGTSTYTAPFTVTQAGLHRVVWAASGAAVGAYADVFEALPTTIGGIVSLEDVQAGLSNTNSDDDETLRSLILMASDICEQRTGIWRRQTLTGTFDGGGDKLHLRRPVVSVTSVTENGTTIAASGYTLDTARGWLWRGGQTTPMCWYWGRQNITVTYVAGAPSGIIPEPIRKGVIELARYQFNQSRGGGLPRNAGFDGVIDPASGWLIPRPVTQAWQPYAPVLVA